MTEPRDPRELLAMLAAKPQHFAVAPGGILGLTPDDIAGALGMMNRRAANFARLKYAHDTTMIIQVAANLYGASTDIRGREKWRQPRKDFIWDMCRLAIAEEIAPDTCLWCMGRKEARIGSKIIVCNDCRGTGKKVTRETDRASVMGISRQNWSQNWSERYRDIRMIVGRWDDIVHGALRDRIGS